MYSRPSRHCRSNISISCPRLFSTHWSLYIRWNHSKPMYFQTAPIPPLPMRSWWQFLMPVLQQPPVQRNLFSSYCHSLQDSPFYTIHCSNLSEIIQLLLSFISITIFTQITDHIQFRNNATVSSAVQPPLPLTLFALSSIIIES